MPVLKNRAYVVTATTGTGTITLGSPVSGYQSFTDAGLTTGAVTRYTIQDGANWEIGLGTYTTAGNTLTRTPSESSSGGSAINLSGNAEVFIAATAEDVSPLYDANFVTQTTSSFLGPNASGTDAVAIGLDAQASGTRSVGIGALATGTNVGAIATGNGAVALGGSNASGVEAFSANNSRNDTSFGSTGANSVTLGYQSRAQATYSVAIGYAAIAGGQYGIALGFSRANGEQSFSIGQNASTASGENTIVIGKAISSSVDNEIAIGGTGNTIKLFNAYTLPTSDGAAGTALVTDGSGALSFSSVGADLYAVNPVSATDPVVNGDNSIAIGSAAVAGSATGNNDKIAIGTGATAGNNQRVLALGYYAAAGASGQSATAVGSLAVASGPHSTAIGSGTDATATSATALGYNAQAVGSSEAIAIGNSRAGGISSFAAQIGSNSSSYGATGNNATAVGMLTKATGLDFVFGKSSIASGGSGSLSLGMDNTSSGAGAVTLGKNNTASHTDAVVIGQGASSSAADQITLGHTDQTVRISSAYTLPTTDGSAGTALVTNGSGALSFSAVGADLYAANPSSATDPTANALNSVAIGDGMTTGSSAVGGIAIGQDGTVSGTNSVSLGKSGAYGTGSFAAAISSVSYQTYGADGDYSISVGYRSRASSSGAIAIGYEAKSLNNYSTAISRSYASGADSFAAAIANNTSSYGATGANSIAIGYQNIANDPNAVAIGKSNISSGSQTSIAIGQSNNVTGMRGVAIGSDNTVSGLIAHAYGADHTVSGQYAVALNRNNDAASNYSFVSGFYADSHAVKGRFARGTGGLSLNGTKGDAQYGLLVLVKNTTDATQTALSTDTLTAGNDNQLVVQNNGAVAFHGTIVAKQASSSNVAAWEVKGLMHNVTTATLVNSAITVINNAPGWGLAISADTTNDAVQFLVTGAASTNISWVATIHSSEVIRS